MCKGRPDGAQCERGRWCDVFGRVCGGGSCVGLGFGKCFQEKCERLTSDNLEITCATDVVFNIMSVCKSNGAYKMLISNSGKDLVGWKIKLYQTGEKTESLDSSEGVQSFGVKYITITPATVTEVRKLEAVPVIHVGNTDFTCALNTDSYGELEGEPITEECK